jgi:glycosyltransferase involved in cell wall biosynthesis
MRKFVHILYAGLGGHGSVLFTLLENEFMSSLNHHVIFVGVEEPRSEYVSRCEALNIPWSYVPRNLTTSYAGFVFNLYKKTDSISPDMVFAHGLAAAPSMALLRLFARRRRLIVLRETQAHHLKSVREWIFLLLANPVFDRIVYLTKEAQSGARARLGIFHSKNRSVVIGNGLDTNYFWREGRTALAHPVKIGMQSRLQANKDHRTLIDAFRILLSMELDSNISLHIAGDGATLEALKQYVDSLGLTDKVFFLGMLGQEALRDFLVELSIYVHCTHGETMSTAIMQALSMGLPTIAADVPGVSNMIDGSNGLMYRPGDASDLAKKMNDVLHDEEMAASLSFNARQSALNNYSNNVLVSKYNQIFGPYL